MATTILTTGYGTPTLYGQYVTADPTYGLFGGPVTVEFANMPITMIPGTMISGPLPLISANNPQLIPTSPPELANPTFPPSTQIAGTFLNAQQPGSGQQTPTLNEVTPQTSSPVLTAANNFGMTNPGLYDLSNNLVSLTTTQASDGTAFTDIAMASYLKMPSGSSGYPVSNNFLMSPPAVGAGAVPMPYSSASITLGNETQNGTTLLTPNRYMFTYFNSTGDWSVANLFVPDYTQPPTGGAVICAGQNFSFTAQDWTGEIFTQTVTGTGTSFTVPSPTGWTDINGNPQQYSFSLLNATDPSGNALTTYNNNVPGTYTFTTNATYFSDYNFFRYATPTAVPTINNYLTGASLAGTNTTAGTGYWQTGATGGGGANYMYLAGVPVTDFTVPPYQFTVTVNPAPILTLSKTAPATVIPGVPFNYILNIGNTATATGPTSNPYTITETLPAGVSLNSTSFTTSNGCSVTASGTTGTVTLTVNCALAVGQNDTLNLPATLTSGQTSVGQNTATVNSTGACPVSATASAPPPTVIYPIVTVTKTASTTQVATGGTFNYTITVTNTGTSPTTGPFTVADNLPPNTSLNGTPTITSGYTVTNTGTSTGLNLSISPAIFPSNSVTITIPVLVSSTTPIGPLANNTATAHPGYGMPPASGTSPSPTVFAPLPSLTVTKSASVTTTTPGSIFNYTVVVTNTGTGPTTAPFVFTDILPPNVTLNGAPSATGYTLTANATSTNTNLNYNISPALNTNSTMTLTIPVAVNPSAPTGTLGINSATLTPGNNGNPATGTDTPPTITMPVLTVTKNSTPTTLQSGDNFDYEITITNTGNAPTTNPYTITDTLPSGIAINGPLVSSLAGTTATANGTTGTVVISVNNSLPPNGETQTILIPVSMPIGMSIIGQNTATVNPGNGGNPVTAVDTPPTVLMPEVSVTKVASVEESDAGGSFDYVITVTNNGAGATSNPMIVSDVLPANVTLTGTPSSNTGTITNSGTNTSLVLNYTPGLAPNGGSVTITLPVTVSNAAEAGPLNPNTVTVNPGNELPPVSGTEVTPVVIVAPILEATKTADAGANNYGYFIGDTFNYQVIINNLGTGASYGQQIVDTLSNNVTLASTPTATIYTGLNGAGSATTGVVTATTNGSTVTITSTSTIPANGSLVITIPVTVNSGTPVGQTLPNSATISDTNNPNIDATTPALPNVPFVLMPVLQVSKVASVTDIYPGGSFFYTITVKNTGNAATEETFTLTDTLPANVSLSGTPTYSLGSAALTSQSNPVTLNLTPALAPGAVGTVTIPVVVAS